MAGTSLLALLDDIASTLDDVAAMTKVAAKKTAGVVGDDLALNAQSVTGITADRELPVVWAVAKGSFVNKLILVPAALAISQFAPFLVTPLLVIGGLFLCYEGVEKIVEKIFHSNDHAGKGTPLADSLESFEKERVRGAVRTDFILSAEIIVIALGTVSEAPLMSRILVLSGLGLGMTIGVYGLVAAIVKIDDAGLWLMRRPGAGPVLGRALVGFTPWLMKGLGIAGTLAMFLVGGGIVTHAVPALHHLQEELGTLLGLGLDLAIGVTAGAVIVGVVSVAKRIR